MNNYMAPPWVDAVVNPCNTRWSATEIAYSLDDFDMRVLLIDDPIVPMAAKLRVKRRSLATLFHVGDGLTPEAMLSYEALIESHASVADAGRGGKDLPVCSTSTARPAFPSPRLAHAQRLARGRLPESTGGLADC